MAKTVKTGKRLESLVASLERILADQNAKIEAPSRRLIDKDTGKSREFDVLIIWDHGHHKIITAVECRDRSRPVGVPEIEAFVNKCQKTGVHQGVVVSASGFRNTARVKAEACAITCMDISEAEKFDWIALDAVVGYQRCFDHIDARIMFKNAQPDEIAVIIDTAGNELTQQQLMQTIINSVPKAENQEDEVGQEFPVKLRLQTENWTARDTTGKIWQIDHIDADTKFTTEKTLNPIKSYRYSGGGKEYDVVSSDANIGDTRGKIMFLRNDDGTTSVHWTPTKN